MKTVEVAAAVAAEGGCTIGEVKTGEIKKRSPRGMGSVWVQCPTTAAKKVAGKGKITIGWVAARVEALAARPIICFKCMERGHTARNCTSTKDRSNCCYNCGEKGHQAKVCAASPRCPVCVDLGLPASHRLGGKACNPPITRKKVGKEAEPETYKAPENAVGKARPIVTNALTTNESKDKEKRVTAIQERGQEEAMEIAV